MRRLQMAAWTTVADSVKSVPLFAAGGTVDDEVAQLAAAQAEIGLVVDREGRLCWLVDRSGRHLPLQVPPSASLHSLIDSPEIAERIAEGAPGVVAVDDGAPIGFLPASAILDAMASDYAPRPRVMGDETLHDEITLPSLVVVCETCDRRNELISFDAGKTRCASGHVLLVSWA